MEIKINKKYSILFLLAFFFIFAMIGAASADPVTKQNTSNSKVLNSNTHAGDPIINGTVTISEYGHIRNLENATVTITSGGRTVGTGTTDSNGYYSINFYSTATSFSLTASSIGCPSVTQTVNVAHGPNYPTDPNYYGTGNFQLTPYTATVKNTSTGRNDIYIQGEGSTTFAGIITVTVNGKDYQSYCIDLFTDINTGASLLVNGPLPGTAGDVPKSVDWGKVNYIVNHYTPSSNDEAAAIQCAIWYYTSVMYGPYPGNDPNHPGYYQFMTAPNDGKRGGATGSSTVRNRALTIIAEAQSMLYPKSIIVTPEITRIVNGGTATITATVYDNNGNPLPGITVNFTRTGSGTLTPASGTTNANGQVSAVLSGITNNSSTTVTATVSGNYGNLLYDNQYTTRLQNLVARNLATSNVSDISIVNSDLQADVTLNKTVNTTPVNVGDTVIFTVTATNGNQRTATGLMISDPIPAGFNVTSITASTGTTYYNGIWTIPTLAINTSATLTMTGKATAAMAGLTATNTATRIAQDQYNSKPATVSASVYTKKADVTMTKTASTSTPSVGHQFYYTITLLNKGLDAATNINVTDGLPAGLTFNSYTATQGTYANGIWNVGTLNKDATATLTLYVTPTMATAGQTITNTATETQTEYDPTPATAQATVNIRKAVELTKTGDYSTYCGNIIWRIYAENTTNVAFNNLTINDLIGPESQTKYWTYYVSYDNGMNWGKDGSYKQLTGDWTINQLPAGATYILAIYATPLNGTSKTYTNTATYGDQQATGSLYIPDNIVNMTKTGDYNSATNQIIWTITVTNSGNDTTNNLYVWDLMGTDSPGTTYNDYRVSYDNGTTWVQDGSYNPEYGEWVVNGLDKGETFILEIYAIPTNGKNRTYNNTATDSFGHQARASVQVSS